ncbi:N-acetylneuraminate synthase [Solibacillus sp. FSL W8-0372]|uniref:N-acetylneuraminate synthase n=1 Tax=Solibacillus sp. FSL W8-0372 TaxID=2921713 RepID=UPI0030CD8187
MTYIIAEAGVNHNGSSDMAKQLVDIAKEAGADAVKFQTFKAENLVTKNAKQADYQIENLKESTSQFHMLKKLELTFEEFTALRQYCVDKGIEFLSTPFDYESVDFLFDDLQINTAKIPSGELTNSPFIYAIAKKKKPIILSTGMATIDDIHEALSYIAFGLANKTEMEQVAAFYTTQQAKRLLQQYVTILHCTTEYPAPFDTINLHAMATLQQEFRVSIGLSDHSEGIAVPTAAVALGAKVIEKHFTLDKTLEGPDHVASLEPQELKQMVKQIREVEQALGNGHKVPSAIELKNRIPARKSLVARMAIEKGKPFTAENLTVKRPGSGIAPSNYWAYLGKQAEKSYEQDELINE